MYSTVPVDAASRAPSVLLIAGAYHPEISASGLQCQAVAAALRGRADFQKLVAEVEARAEKPLATAPLPREKK